MLLLIKSILTVLFSWLVVLFILWLHQVIMDNAIIPLIGIISFILLGPFIGAFWGATLTLIYDLVDDYFPQAIQLIFTSESRNCRKNAVNDLLSDSTFKNRRATVPPPSRGLVNKNPDLTLGSDNDTYTAGVCEKGCLKNISVLVKPDPYSIINDLPDESCNIKP